MSLQKDEIMIISVAFKAAKLKSAALSCGSGILKLTGGVNGANV
jgi:hypothetical protein